MKTIVTYKSTSGFTKKYAQWIADALNADMFPRREVTPTLLSGYDCIIHGGSLHAVGIAGVDIIKKNLLALRDKRIIVFATGASPEHKNIPEIVRSGNFHEDELHHIRVFYLRGGFDYSKLNLGNKILMTLMKWKIKIKKPEHRTADERGMLAAFDTPFDATRPEKIAPLVEYAKSNMPA